MSIGIAILWYPWTLQDHVVGLNSTKDPFPIEFFEQSEPPRRKKFYYIFSLYLLDGMGIGNRDEEIKAESSLMATWKSRIKSTPLESNGTGRK